MEVPPNQTIYVNNLSEKLKKVGISDFVGRCFARERRLGERGRLGAEEGGFGLDVVAYRYMHM